MQSLLLLFKKNSPKAQTKPCSCILYEDLGCFSRNLFDEEFPTSSSVRAFVGHNVRSVKLGAETSIECKPDNSVVATAVTEIERKPFRVAGSVECGDKTRGKFIAGVSDIPKLPGLLAELTLSNKEELCTLKSQYRHRNFSILSNNAFKENHDVSLGLSTVGCCRPASVVAGVTTEVILKKSKAKSFCDFAFTSIDGRACFVRGPWNLFLEATNFGRDYSLSVMRKMMIPRLTNEMIIAARLSAHAARPDMSSAKTFMDKITAVKTATTPKADVVLRTKLSQSSSAKIKVDSKGMVGFSFAEQLSQWAHAVFAVNVDATHLSKADNHKFAFTLTLMH